MYLHSVIEFYNVIPRQLLLATRVWLLFYDLKHAQSLLRHKWWTIISNEQDWYLKNKKKYGSFKYILKYFIVLILTFWIFYLFACKYAPDIVAPITGMFCQIIYVVMIVCFCKMPSIYDALKIRKEINLMSAIFFVQATYMATDAIFEFSMKYSFYPIITSISVPIVAILFGIIMVLMPNWDTTLNNVDSDFKEEDSVTLSSDTNETKNREKCKLYKSWQMYVNDCPDDERWNIFIRHLIREFASENLCFLLELMQYKQQFVDWDSILNERLYFKDDEKGWIIKLPPNLPQSAIISENKNNYQLQVQLLYRKYIEESAGLQVNTSFASKSIFMSKYVELSSLQENELMIIFDNILESVLQNLASSFIRFRMNLDEYESHKKHDIISVMMSQAK